jgi:hypothetical protein
LKTTKIIMEINELEELPFVDKWLEFLVPSLQKNCQRP